MTKKSTAKANVVATDSSGTEPALIPLSHLNPKPAKQNVRTAPRVGIEELANTIAAVGLLQNLVVIAAAGGQSYHVVAGARRLAALRVLAKRKTIAPDHPVPCLVIGEEDPRTVSLIENHQRQAMHPADEFAAFAALVRDGKPVEDVAALFGVTPLVVRRRLKLAAISPRLMADYRKDKVSLDQLMALAVTDDHEKQDAAFYTASEWQRSAQQLRARLLESRVAVDDRRVSFVGLDTYRAAGGAVEENLFATEDGNRSFLTDPELLDRLVTEKLDEHAAAIRAEGWKWVETAPDSGDRYGLDSIAWGYRTPDAQQEARLAEIAREHSGLSETLEALSDQEDRDDECAELEQRLDALDDATASIRDSLRVLPNYAVALTGALVALDTSGRPQVSRGLVKREDRRALAEARKAAEASTDTPAPDDADDPDDGRGAADAQRSGAPLSKVLSLELSCLRTAALQVELARRPHAALALLVNTLLGALVFDENQRRSVIEIRASRIGPRSRVSREASPQPQTVDARLDELRLRLSEDHAVREAALLAMSDARLTEILALCVACSLNAMDTPDGRPAPAQNVAVAVELDMADHWSATAESYFLQVPKALALAAVQEFAPGDVRRLAKLKKPDLAREAERLSKGSRWLPPVFRRPQGYAQDESMKRAVSDEGVRAVPVETCKETSAGGHAEDDFTETDDEAESAHIAR